MEYAQYVPRRRRKQGGLGVQRAPPRLPGLRAAGIHVSIVAVPVGPHFLDAGGVEFDEVLQCYSVVMDAPNVQPGVGGWPNSI